ncbi:MAG: BMP family ABC transporter substrate-binding protein [Spirochaetaceae bacterium]|nr:MAG: BMP family ABC transporter substrate-binding protein [Spirochaetaceae bacterium]
MNRQTSGRASRFTVVAIMVLLTLIAPVVAFAGGAAQQRQPEGVRIAVVFGRGGLGDQSFNDAAYRGLQRGASELGITYDYAEPMAVAEFENFLNQFASTGAYGLIISIGFEQGDALRAVSAAFPDQRFAIIDTVVDAPNVASFVYAEKERGFMMGAAAALTTLDANMPLTNRNRRVSVVGGVQSPLIDANVAGFIAGARYIDRSVEATFAYVGSFGDPARGKEIAISMIEGGSDVVWQAAGRSGLGVLDAAMERGVYGMGADSDQSEVAPGHVLTNGLKLVDETVFIAIQRVVNNEFAAGLNRLGLADGALGFNDGLLAPATITRLNDIRARIISGEIQIPDSIAEAQAF